MAGLLDIKFTQNESPVIITNVGNGYLCPFTIFQRNEEEKSKYLSFQLLSGTICIWRQQQT